MLPIAFAASHQYRSQADCVPLASHSEHHTDVESFEETVVKTNPGSSSVSPSQLNPAMAVLTVAEPDLHGLSFITNPFATVAAASETQSMQMYPSSMTTPATTAPDVVDTAVFTVPPGSLLGNATSSHLGTLPSSETEPPSPAAAHSLRGDRPVSLKLLINTAWATALIGRQGCNIKALSSSTGCTVQLSEKASFFPGTKARVLLVRGALPSMEEALHVILRRRDELPIQAANPSEVDCVSMLVPHSLCSTLRGPDDRQLQALAEQTKTEIAFAHRDKQGPFIPDRILRITGTRTQSVIAVMAILRFLLTHTAYRSTVTGLTPFKTVTVPIPTKAVGAIMGKGGEAIEQLQSVMGVSMSMSANRSSSLRELAISGLPHCILMTVQHVLAKVWQVEPQYVLPQETQQVLSSIQQVAAGSASPGVMSPAGSTLLGPALGSVHTMSTTMTLSPQVSIPLAMPLPMYQPFWQPIREASMPGHGPGSPPAPRLATRSMSAITSSSPPGEWQRDVAAGSSALHRQSSSVMLPVWHNMMPWGYAMPSLGSPMAMGPAIAASPMGQQMPMWAPQGDPSLGPSSPVALPMPMQAPLTGLVPQLGGVTTASSGMMLGPSGYAVHVALPPTSSVP